MSKQFCKICRGQRGVMLVGTSKMCEGCGTPADNCFLTVTEKAKQKLVLKCPLCRSPNADLLEARRWLCATCGTVYEALEQSFLDDRPDVNLEKKERQR